MTRIFKSSAWRRLVRLVVPLLAFSGLVMAPVTLCADADANPPAVAAFTAHVDDLKTKVPRDFTMVTQPPFIVLGDEAPTVVQQRATNTVKWAVDRLKKDFFKKDPSAPIDIWLFRDGDSYTNHTRQLFNETPFSRFGYYAAEHHSLVMNISTGSGTLVHEIVHPFLEANFPQCPAWFNEGLASLFEASGERDGHIVGRINWRFKGLEAAIKEGRTPTFRQLTSMSAAEFYGGDNSANYSQHYAQARYLCYYLQEKGLLVRFYHEFASSVKDDPSGLATLQHVLGENDMEAFQKKWEKFILGLRTP